MVDYYALFYKACGTGKENANANIQPA